MTNLTNTCGFLEFPKLPERAKIAASFGHSNAENFSASGGLRPLTSWQGALPLDPAGGTATRPHYRLALRARHGPCPRLSWVAPPRFQNSGYGPALQCAYGTVLHEHLSTNSTCVESVDRRRCPTLKLVKFNAHYHDYMHICSPVTLHFRNV